MKITRRQLNDLIREHLGVKTQINEIGGAAIAGIFAGVGALIAGGYELSRQLSEATPTEETIMILDPDHRNNPVSRLKPVLEARKKVGEKQAHVFKFGMSNTEVSQLTNMIRKATVDMSLGDMLTGEGATNEAQIGEALRRCSCKYGVAQVAHRWKKLKLGDGKSLAKVLQDELNKEDYIENVVNPIFEHENFITGTHNGAKFAHSLEEFDQQMTAAYEKYKIQKAKEEKTTEEETKEVE